MKHTYQHQHQYQYQHPHDDENDNNNDNDSDRNSNSKQSFSNNNNNNNNHMIKITVNGKVHAVTPTPTLTPSPFLHPSSSYNIDPSTMRLSTYLRDVLGFKGVKVCCGEGGCGSCTILYSTPLPSSSSSSSFTLQAPTFPLLIPIHSCLRLLQSCDNAIIITPEGLGGSGSPFHKIQKALADGNGVQCGFCSPGFTMSTLGYWMFLQSFHDHDDYSSSSSSSSGGSNDDDDDDEKEEKEWKERIKLGLERYLDGHICRCTGYRPILESLGDVIVQQERIQRQRRQKERKKRGELECQHQHDLRENTPHKNENDDSNETTNENDYKEDNDDDNNDDDDDDSFAPLKQWGVRYKRKNRTILGATTATTKNRMITTPHCDNGGDDKIPDLEVMHKICSHNDKNDPRCCKTKCKNKGGCPSSSSTSSSSLLVSTSQAPSPTIANVHSYNKNPDVDNKVSSNKSNQMPPQPPPPPPPSLSSHNIQHHKYYNPTTIHELLVIYKYLLQYQTHQSSSSSPILNIYFVAANTSAGIRHYYSDGGGGANKVGGETIKIDLNDIQELKEFYIARGGDDVNKNEKLHSVRNNDEDTGGANNTVLRVGSMTSIANLCSLLRYYSSAGNDEHGIIDTTWTSAADHLDIMGNTSIRSIATWGGNISFALRCCCNDEDGSFDSCSDVVLVLVGLKATISYLDLRGFDYNEEEVEKEKKKILMNSSYMGIQVKQALLEELLQKCSGKKKENHLASYILILSVSIPRYGGLLAPPSQQQSKEKDDNKEKELLFVSQEATNNKISNPQIRKPQSDHADAENNGIAFPCLPICDDRKVKSKDGQFKIISRTYRVSSRSANSRAHVGCYIAACVSRGNGNDDSVVGNGSKTSLVVQHGYSDNNLKSDKVLPESSVIKCFGATVIFSGLTKSILNAKNCASVMINSRGLNSEDIMRNCLKGLDEDIKEAGGMVLGNETTRTCDEYRLNVARGMVYKFFLAVNGRVDDDCKDNACEADETGRNMRKLMSSGYDYAFTRKNPIQSIQLFSCDNSTYPVTFPIPKIDSWFLSSGEAKYTLDYDLPMTGLHGALIISSSAAVIFRSIDVQAALSMDGIVDVITADDIPARNSILPCEPAGRDSDEMLFLESGEMVPCVGTCLGLVVGVSRKHAQDAARFIPVEYETCTDGTRGIFSLESAIQSKSTFTSLEPKLRGDVKSGLKKSPMKLNGQVLTGGQKHFYLENQNAIAYPEEGGCLTVRSATQSVTTTQSVISSVLGISSHRINIIMKRTGGAFGGKITRSFHCAAAAAIAASKTKCPVHVSNPRDIDLAMTGGREPLIVDYDVGFNGSGQLLALSLVLHMDAGCTIDESESDLNVALMYSDHSYFVPDFRADANLYKTNLPSNTSCRAPGSVQVCHAVDTILFRVAQTCNLTMQECQEINMYRKGQTTLTGDIIQGATLQKLWKSLLADINIEEKRKEVAAFNSKQRWKKRGIGITPCKYGLVGSWFKEIAKVSVFAFDGSVEINHSGAEMGQGIDTKVAQVASMALGVPLDCILTGEKSSNSQPNCMGTLASATSEVCCAAMFDACKIINERLEPYKAKVRGKSKAAGTPMSGHEIFIEAATAADQDRICLSSEGWSAPKLEGSNQYFAYCSAAVEVELDILTGCIEIKSVNIAYDCGNQLNAYIDIGQIEGGFVMGLGYFLSENVIFDQSSGKLASKNTWDYKPFSSMDVPSEFNIRLMQDSPNTAKGAFLRSKATGEPPLVCSSAAHFAVREAVDAARKDAGSAGDFNLATPATVEKRYLACKVDSEQFSL